MESGLSGRLVGSEIHGFHTLQDLDIQNIMEESKSRWLRPNEIHAMLYNHKYFTINVKPVNLPPSGTIVLFDRKMLRNFRKDGHNWKKKKDGKTVKEAHEHLKVGNEERIHVYYAHGEDNPTFVRRCYWLLDKTLEHIVLVHYRETQELQGSPVTPVNSNSSSASDQAAALLLSEELDSGAAPSYYSASNDSLSIRNHAMRLHEINTLEWEELVANNPNSTAPGGDNNASSGQQNLTTVSGAVKNGSALPAYNVAAEISALGDLTVPNVESSVTNFNILDSFYDQSTAVQSNSLVQGKDSGGLGTGGSLDILFNDSLQSQDSFGRWIDSVIAHSPSSDDSMLKSSVSSGQDSLASPEIGQHQSSIPEQIFTITDFSPAWAFSTETTKVLVTGYFHDRYLNLSKSSMFCICGDTSVPAQTIQPGVYSCMVSPHPPGLVNFCLSLDGHRPISQIMNFEYRTPLPHDHMVASEDKSKWEQFQLQMRLAYLLCSRSKTLNILTSKVSPTNVKDARKFAEKTSHISSSWVYLINGVEENRFSYSQAKDGLFELALKNMLKEWLLERVLEGGKSTEYDGQGLGVIHLCAILGYTWAVHMFSWSGLSLDFRDKHGWTALHWAAFHGREKMVAVLLSVGAKPNLVADPTTKNPGGCTAADLASANGYDGLAAYLSEKALVAHFEAMSMAGNVSGSLQSSTNDTANSNNLSQEELYLKETLAAYRTAADAAARIQSAFREHAFKVRSKAIQVENPEDEARNIIAAMKIQHAFRNFETKKKMAAAARIQHRFRTWRMRKEFLNTRKQVIRIQAAFRGFQVRRQYRKIIWSVGVLEKAILRWRLKRRGFRGLHVDPVESVAEPRQESDVEEDFYKTSQQQAEERVERCVVRVQALFRSKKAQEEYQSMKLAHTQATMEYKELLDADIDMER